MTHLSQMDRRWRQSARVQTVARELYKAWQGDVAADLDRASIDVKMRVRNEVHAAIARLEVAEESGHRRPV